MPEITKLRHNRFRLIAAFLVVGIISLVQPGCDSSSSNLGTATPSVITSVSPESNSVTALVTTEVTALFRDEMDSTTVESAFSLTVNSSPVVTGVNYDAATKTATLSPATDLVSNTEYRATIASSVKDVNGNSPLSTDYVWSFTTSSAMLLTSKNASGVTGNDISKAADIDATGRYIVFESKATNLTSIATTPGMLHIYRKDTITGEVILVSSDDSGLVEANNKSSNPSISTNGRYVVFESTATNLDAAITSPGTFQIYLKDLENGSVDLVSRSATFVVDNGAGAKNASVSDDGRFVVFESDATNLDAVIPSGGISQIYLKDMSDESVAMISRQNASFAGDAASTNPDMSSDGTHIVFESSATNLTTTSGFRHIYYVDTSVVHKVERISVVTGGVANANAHSNKPSISNDGSTVVFHTNATNLDVVSDNNGLADVYLHYRPLTVTSLISTNMSATNGGDNDSINAYISGNADYVVFESLASDLVNGDTNGLKDIFVRNLSVLPTRIIERVNNPESSSEATAASDSPVISTDGRYVSFHSIEPYTIDDTDTLRDVFRAHNSTHP